MTFTSQIDTFYGVDLREAYPPKFQGRCICIYICNSFDRQFVQPINLKRVGCIEGVLSVDDIKNYKI